MRIPAIDSHTGGEPTRVVLQGGIDLQGNTMAERRLDLATRLDHLRSGIVNEPRGSEVLVGAVLTPPVEPDSICGVVFFNTVGCLGMCGHGTIGVVETLRHLGLVQSGQIRIDTPVGTVAALLEPTGDVTLTNVESYCYKQDVEVEVPGMGLVRGDIAYGGNWFFLVHAPNFDIGLHNRVALTETTLKIRRALEEKGITGENGAEIDHIELGGESEINDSRNFVMCPGGAYDRSPCGTGTSAKLACLFAHGELEEGAEYRQESVTGSVFRGRVEAYGRGVIPTITGQAHITAEITLFFDESDDLKWGLPV